MKSLIATEIEKAYAALKDAAKEELNVTLEGVVVECNDGIKSLNMIDKVTKAISNLSEISRVYKLQALNHSFNKNGLLRLDHFLQVEEFASKPSNVLTAFSHNDGKVVLGLSFIDNSAVNPIMARLRVDLELVEVREFELEGVLIRKPVYKYINPPAPMDVIGKADRNVLRIMFASLQYDVRNALCVGIDWQSPIFIHGLEEMNYVEFIHAIII